MGKYLGNISILFFFSPKKVCRSWFGFLNAISECWHYIKIPTVGCLMFAWNCLGISMRIIYKMNVYRLIIPLICYLKLLYILSSSHHFACEKASSFCASFWDIPIVVESQFSVWSFVVHKSLRGRAALGIHHPYILL